MFNLLQYQLVSLASLLQPIGVSLTHATTPSHGACLTFRRTSSMRSAANQAVVLLFSWQRPGVIRQLSLSINVLETAASRIGLLRYHRTREICEAEEDSREGVGRRARISPRVAAAMAAVESWADLPDKFLVRVSAFLSCRADRVHMAGVNRHWRAAVTGLGQSPPPVLPELPPQLPWLVFPSTEPPTFYSMLGDRYHRLHGQPADVRSARYCGSGDGGWLVIAFPPPHGHALYNLNTRDRILLPEVFRSPSHNTEIPLIVDFATLSASPSQGPYAVAASAVVDGRPTIAFWTPGRDSWFSTEGAFNICPQDVIYFLGGFSFVFPGEQIVLFRVTHGTDGDVTIGRAERLDIKQRANYGDDVQAMFDAGGRMNRYLVVSRGRLLMVVRYVFGNEPYERTDFLRVFQLCSFVTATTVYRPRGIWKNIRNPDGRMLLLGTGCSRSFEVARYDGFRECEIYFLEESYVPLPVVVDDDDDDNDNDEPDAADMGSVHDDLPDTGRYYTVKMQGKPWPPGPVPRSDVPPFWWLH
jgi:hypothetical protein